MFRRRVSVIINLIIKLELMMERISHDNYELIILEGRVDQAESEELESILSDCVEDGKINICIDMIEVKHICSSALGVLVAIKRKIKAINYY